MPTYQYRCNDCGSDLEAVQKFTDPALTECPSCAGRLRKVFNPVGVVFKGSGFYRTDSRSADRSAEKVGASANGSGNGNGTSAGSSAEKTGSAEKSGSAGKSGSKQPATAGSSSGSSSTAA